MKQLAVVIALLSVASVAAQGEGSITSPEQAFDFKPGNGRKLADWTQLTSYFRALSTQLDRIRYEEVGKTTEMLPAPCAVVFAGFG